MDLNSKNVKKILLIIVFGAIVFTAMQNLNIVGKGIYKIISVFQPVIVGLCIAFVLNVLLYALENKVFAFMKKNKYTFVVKMQRPLCLVLTYLIALGIIVLIILVIIPEISKTVIYLTEKLPSSMGDVKIWIENTLQHFNVSEDFIPDFTINWSAVGKTIKDFIFNYSNTIFGSAVNITSSVVSAIFNTVFSVMISIYVLAQKEKIGRFTTRCIDCFIPKKAREIIYHISFQTYDSFSKFIGGQLTESVIIGILFFLGMTIFRFPNAPIISVVICVTSLIPIIGATIGVIFGFLLIVISDPIKALLFIVFFIVVQQIDGSLIYPKVVGRSVGLPGVIVVSAVLVGGNISGIIGSLVSVPFSAVIFVLLKEAIENKTNKNKLRLNT